MDKKYVFVLFIAFLTITNTEGKRSRRIRRPNNEEDNNTTPQPSVVSYSTFGFNDVGSYSGFVPSSPDYASYLSDNQETTTRLYAPAFPSAVDPTGFNNNFGSLDGSSIGDSDDNEPQSSMIQYPQSSVSFYNTPSFEGNNNQNKNTYEVNEQTDEEPSDLVYGTKLNSKNKKPPGQVNNSEFNVYSSGPLANSQDLASRFVMPGVQSTFDGKNTYGESGTRYQNDNSYAPNYPSSDVEEFVKPAPSNPHNALKFPKVVDFTKIKQYYPTELDNKYQVATYSSIMNQNENVFPKNNEEHNNKFIQPTPTIKDMTSFNTKTVDESSRIESPKQTPYLNQDYRQNLISSTPSKTNYKGANYNQEYKDNYKNRNPPNYSNNDSKISINPMKGYEYSTNYSSTSFTYDFDSDHKPFNSNTDELVPASSNIVDFSNYNYPENDYSNFKKVPEVNIPYEEDFDVQFNKDKFQNDEFISQFKNLYTTTPTSSQWGSFFKSNDYSYKNRIKKPYGDENTNGDVVHIPKRPFSSYKHNSGKHHESKPIDYPKQRPYKSSKYEKPKDVFSTRYKSEEDLLGLRNHDTSHSYTPQHRPNNNDLVDENDYKKLVEKWRQSYLKSKYKDAYRDYESYASESKPLHVPIPKPYPIEVPQPVIVPIPQPYPVRVPIPKPVAVPVIRELKVPVEKPVPYPVIKNVPYPVEKPVPVVVEKEVAMPVVKPYPVHIPHVRPVFHHSRPPREDFDSEIDEDEIRHRPDTSKRIPSYKQRPRTCYVSPQIHNHCVCRYCCGSCEQFKDIVGSSTRTRPRRPTRTTYERNRDHVRERRRGPQSYRPADRSRRPSSEVRYPQHRHHDYESDQYDNEPISGDLYYLHCKRTGNC